MKFDPAILLSWYAVFVFSASFHEAAHAWVARLGGDDTAYAGGQVSLNPIPHIRREPFGMVVFPIISLLLVGWPLGFASAPYDPYWADRHPKRAAVMALAGPMSNLLIALVVLLIMWIGIQAGIFSMGDTLYTHSIVQGASGGMAYGLAILLSMLLVMNFLLFLLNIMPIPPLDGSAILPMFLSHNAMEKYRVIAESPITMIFGFMIIWKLIGVIFWPSLTVLLRVLT
jgi:Zn-dependent protease